MWWRYRSELDHIHGISYYYKINPYCCPVNSDHKYNIGSIQVRTTFTSCLTYVSFYTESWVRIVHWIGWFISPSLSVIPNLYSRLGSKYLEGFISIAYFPNIVLEFFIDRWYWLGFNFIFLLNNGIFELINNKLWSFIIRDFCWWGVTVYSSSFNQVWDGYHMFIFVLCYLKPPLNRINYRNGF